MRSFYVSLKCSQTKSRRNSMKARQFGRAGISERVKRMNGAALLRHMLADLYYDPAIVPAKLLRDL